MRKLSNCQERRSSAGAWRSVKQPSRERKRGKKKRSQAGAGGRRKNGSGKGAQQFPGRSSFIPLALLRLLARPLDRRLSTLLYSSLVIGRESARGSLARRGTGGRVLSGIPAAKWVKCAQGNQERRILGAETSAARYSRDARVSGEPLSSRLSTSYLLIDSQSIYLVCSRFTQLFGCTFSCGEAQSESFLSITW